MTTPTPHDVRPWPTAAHKVVEHRDWNARLEPLAPGESIAETLRSARQQALWLFPTAFSSAALLAAWPIRLPFGFQMMVPTLGCALLYAVRSGWRPASLGVALGAVVRFAILLTIVLVLPLWFEGRFMSETWLAQVPGWRGLISYCLDALFLCAGPMLVLDRLGLAAAAARCTRETRGMRFDWLARIFVIQFVLLLVALPIVWFGTVFEWLLPVQWPIAALWTMAVLVTVYAPLPFVMHRRLARSFAATQRVATT